MATEGAVNLYFQAASALLAPKTKKEEKPTKSDKAKRLSFSSAIEKAKQEFELQKEGFPVEIAGMDSEEAAVYLKDQADVAADRLKEHQTPDEFASYRKKVSQFLRYIEKNNFTVEKKDRRGFSRRGKALDPRVKVAVINEKLDQMARWLLSSHKEAFSLLARVEEIRGLLVDLLAS